jgi:methyl-accepting chemotaxis protein
MIKETGNSISSINLCLGELGNSNFTKKIETKLTGSVGSLAQNINTLGDNITSILSIISEKKDSLAELSNDLIESAEGLSLDSTTQAANLEETSASLEEITGNVRLNNEKSENMKRVTEENMSLSIKGIAELESTSESIEEINKIQDDISHAITVIDQIAFQTNILSLNAAVEAATAGEHGKGFAVVATEVRNLAAKSAEAAEDIKSLVQNSLQKAKESEDKVKLVTELFSKLNGNIEETNGLVTEVSEASTEQLVAIEQISNSVSSLDLVTQANAKKASDVSSMSNELGNISKDLSSIIDHTTFNKDQHGLDDVELLFITNRLKFDHIRFKETVMKNVTAHKYDKVVDHHNCGLGKTIDTWTRDSREFAKGSEWNTFNEHHAKVHALGNDLIVHLNNVKNKVDTKTISIFNDIERETGFVFDGLNNVKKNNK